MLEHHLLGVSTCLRPDYDPHVDRFIYFNEVKPFIKALEWIKSAGCDNIELSGKPPSLGFNELKNILRGLELNIITGHNYMDSHNFDLKDRYGDNIAFPDETLRKKALDRTKEGAERLLELGGKALVLHPGSVAGISKNSEFWQIIEIAINKGKENVEEYVSRVKNERERLAPPYIEALAKSLEELSTSVPDIYFCLECRNYPYEIPNVRELSILLKRFEGKRIGYWHDCGHALFQEILGFYKQTEILDAAGDRLIGFHIHDVIIHDHKVPGKGIMDWDVLRPYFKKAKYFIMELAPDTKFEGVREGMGFMRELIP
jgi:sugar phosphate isomerase/epimerase